ncbi:MAG: sigma-70 family RNA polymerase sigma factor [Acidobacteriaceae bacterium]|nr:sigma-70 family RNA polymerase sigma factor [Acidobacteriaceae bacterium]
MEAHTSIVMVDTRAEVIGNIGVQNATGRTDEHALIRAAQRGDSDAFEQLVRSYDGSVLRMALNLLHSEEDARDVYQEAFLRVYRNLPKFRFDCSFSTWLYRIVANLCLDQIRKRKVRREEASSVPTGDGEFDRFQFLPEERADVDPQRQLMSSEVNSRIQQVLNQLTARERLVFEMRHFQGLRLRAIGEALGVTEEAAKNCLFRATQKMRTALGDFV